jgi:DNA-binding NarL/FixJ family response regulator
MNAAKTKILLVDDHLLFRESVARLLSVESDLDVIAQAGSASEAAEKATRLRPDLVLLDFDLGDTDGLDFIRSFRAQNAKSKVLLVTAGVDDAAASELIRLGVSGIFTKHSSPAQLVAAIRSVLAGRVWLEQDRLSRIIASEKSHPVTPLNEQFTAREQQVLSLVFEGLANKEIASRLGISESSVKAALQQLFEKTGVRTRAQLVRVALERHSDL